MPSGHPLDARQRSTWTSISAGLLPVSCAADSHIMSGSQGGACNCHMHMGARASRGML